MTAGRKRAGRKKSAERKIAQEDRKTTESKQTGGKDKIRRLTVCMDIIVTILTLRISLY